MLGTWLAQLVRDARDLAAIPPELREGEADDIFPDLGREGGPPRILISVALSRRLMTIVGGARTPVIAVVDDPVDSVRFTKAERSIDILPAMREQLRIAAGYHLYLDNAAVWLVHRGFTGAAHDIVAGTIEHLRLALDPATLQTLLERFGGPLDAPWSVERALAERAPHYADLAHLGTHIVADEAALVRQALSPLVLGAVSHDIGIITWSAKVFLFGDRPNEVAPAVADVTGAARILYYGPYFHLPPGTWKVRIIVAFSPEMAGTPFRLMIYCGGAVIAKVVLRATDGGAFEGHFMLRHVAPENNIEVHFMSDEGTIEGHVALGRMTFARLAEPG